MPTEMLSNEQAIPEAEASQEDIEPTEEEEEEEGRPSLSRQTSDIQREFADAIVRLASVTELRALLECGADVNKSVTQGLTPLHYAVWQQYPEAAQLLIEEGCDVNTQDDIGYSALHLSAEHGYVEIMKVLLKNNAKVNFNIQNPETEYPMESIDEPLRLSLKHDHYDAARLLLENGANPNTCYFFGHEINLISPYNTTLLNLLLSYGADPNARDRQSFSPLMKACRLQQDSTEDIEHKELISGKEILLHFAQTLMGLETVLLLISFGADVNLRADYRHDNRTVLHYAVLSGSVPIVNLLIKQGAKVNMEESYRRPSPLDLAILKGDTPIVELLIEAGADVNSSSPIIGCPLHMVCSDGIKNRLDILKLLLEKGADPNQIILNDLNEPLRPVLAEYLCSNEELDINVINLLIRFGAEVVMQSQNHDPRGILSAMSKSAKYPDILFTLLEAAHSFDLRVIKSSSQIDEDQRKLFLEVGQSPLPLRHQTRVFLRKFLGLKLPNRMDDLEIPFILKKYLLYEIS